MAPLVKNLPANRRPQFDPWFGKIPWRRDRLPTSVFLGFPVGSAVKESTCNVGDLGSIPGSGRSPGEGNDYPLQYSGLENSMDCIVHGVTKNWTRLGDFHTFISTHDYPEVCLLVFQVRKTAFSCCCSNGPI